jgi:hypothetical protein
MAANELVATTGFGGWGFNRAPEYDSDRLGRFHLRDTRKSAVAQDTSACADAERISTTASPALSACLA